MGTKRTQQPQASIAPFVIAGALLALTVGTYFLLPGFLVAWAILLVGAWAEPAPLMTGPKDWTGAPQPLDSKEETKKKNYAFWRAARTCLLLFSSPGWPPLMSFFLGLAAAGAVFFLPVHLFDLKPEWVVAANSVAAFAIVFGLSSAFNSAVGSPGTRISDVKKTPVPALVASAVVAAVASWYARDYPQFIPLIVLSVVTIPLWRFGLAHWREIVARRHVWTPRWRQIKQDPAPFLFDTQKVGPATADYFSTTGAAALIIESSKKITPAMGPGVITSFLTVPDENTMGPIPGTVHPTKVMIVEWPTEEFPDMFSPETPPDVLLLAARTQWQPRWGQLKVTPAPEVVESRVVGGARVDSFIAPGELGASFFHQMTPKVAPMVEGKLAIVPSPGESPESLHPVKFDIIQWKEFPDIEDPTIPLEVIELALTSQLAWVCVDSFKMGPILPTEIEVLTTEDSPRVFGVRTTPYSGGSKAFRTDGVAAAIGGDGVTDHRADGGPYSIVGALDEGEFLSNETETRIDQLRQESMWDRVWEQALKQGVQPPTLQHQAGLGVTKELADGTPVTRYVFGVLGGLTPEMFFGSEDKVKTALAPAPFVATSGWTMNSKRPGERHPQVVVVYHSERDVPPNPAKLPPSAASEWVLIGMVNAAFSGARLARPELISSRCLSVRKHKGPQERRLFGARSPGESHVWEVQLRLYDGVTLSDVMAARDRLRQVFGVPWLRISPSEHGVTLYVGENPANVELAGGTREQLKIRGLDWEQAWMDAGIRGAGGLLPTLEKAGTMEHNAKVQVLDFALPVGLAVSDVGSGIPKLRTSTGMEFIEVRPVAGAPTKVKVLCSEINPMPFPAPYEIDTVKEAKRIPFASGIDGEPVSWDWYTSPHLLMVGLSGSGKSVSLQMVIEGIVLKGAELYIIDPTKGAADFRFVEPWTSFMAVDIFESAALMKGLYQEVVRRKNLNSKYGVGSYVDLPEEVRPKHIVIVLDEFTSLIEQEAVSRQAYDDFEMERERQEVLASNAARVQVGQIAGKMAREARSGGITLVLATQKLKQDTLAKIPGGSSIKDNAARMLLGASTWGDRSSALRSPDLAPDLGVSIPKGRGIFEPSDSGPAAIQVWYDSTEQLTQWLRDIPQATHKFDIEPFLRRPENDDEQEAVAAVDLDAIFGTSEVMDLSMDEDFLSLDETSFAEEDPDDPFNNSQLPPLADDPFAPTEKPDDIWDSEQW